MMGCRFCEKTRQLAAAALRLPHRPPTSVRSIELLEIVIDRAADRDRVWINADRGCVGRWHRIKHVLVRDRRGMGPAPA